MAEGFLIEQIHIVLGNATHCGKRHRIVRVRAMRLKEWGEGGANRVGQSVF